MEWTRGEWGGVTDIGEREAGERKFPILFLDWTSGDFKEKKKEEKIGSLFSMSCVGSVRGSRHTHVDSRIL